MLRPVRLIAFSFVSLFVLNQYAQANEIVTLTEEESITKKLSMNRAGILGDAYDPISGSVSFAVTDISIPGNSDLKVELRRKFDVPRTNGLLELSGWSLDIPSIMGYFIGPGDSGQIYPANEGWYSGKVCTGDVNRVSASSYNGSTFDEIIKPEAYWEGKFLHIPGETSEAFLAGTGTFAGKQITKSNYYISSCPQRADGLGEAIVVSAPDGKKYTFGYSVDEVARNSPSNGWRYRKVMLVTKVEDQFGNIVNYNYDGRYLTSISSPTDGRSIVLNYVNTTSNGSLKRIESVVANGKTWTYVYGGAYSRLSEVVLPDGSKWTYSPEFYQQRAATTDTYNSVTDPEGYCGRPANIPGPFTFSVGTPEGITINYTIKDIYHGRSNVPVIPNSPSRFATFKMYNCQMRSNLIGKVVSGPKMETQNWSYSYSENFGLYAGYTNVAYSVPPLPYGLSVPESVPNLQAVKTTTILGPDTYQIYYINRDAQSELDNKIVALDTFAKDTSTLQSRTENYFEKGAQVGLWWKLDNYPNYTDTYSQRLIYNISTTEHRVNPSKTIQRIYNSDGTDSYTTEYFDVNLYGQFEKQKESNSFSSAVRYQKQGYLHDATNWVLNLPTLQQLSTDGTTWTSVSETTYYPWSQGGGYKLQAYEQKSFGDLLKKFSAYHADGNIKKVQYNAADRWVEYIDFYRGKARTVSVPGRYIPTAINSFVREVNGDGSTASVTDLKGNKTNFSYDNGFRLSGVDIVDPLWTDSSVTYSYLTAADATLGVVTGQLKQTLTRGNYEKTTFYDALLRPTLVRERDLSSPTTTTRYTNTKYNAKGQQVFTSIPSTSALETLGTETSYDALGRVKSLKEVATSNTKTITYLAGNKQQSKDFKGNLTTTTFKAFGVPEAKMATKIEQPNSVTTTLDYNIFDKILSATQGSFTTAYIYDSKQQLCKLVRPEVGATYYDYSADGDMIWEAQGITSATTTCDRNLVTEDKKISYQYDNQGDLWKTLYPDTTPDKTATLDANGNPATISFGSDSWVYTFNSQNLVETETLNVGGKSFLLDPSYNSLGQVNSLRYPSGKVVAMPKNALGQTKSLASYVSNVTYHPSGAVKTMTYGNGVTVSKDLNNRQLPLEVIVRKSDSSALSDLYYTYDANANVESIQDKLKSAYNMTMSYDGLDRLKNASGYWGAGSFNYDTLGNIKTKTLGSDSLTYNYDTRNRLASVIGYKTYLFDYDSRGNVVENGYNPFAYNLANQMTQTNGISYQYDAYGRRIVKSKNGKNSYSFYDKSGLLLYRQKENGDHINYLYVGKDLVTTVESR